MRQTRAVINRAFIAIALTATVWGGYKWWDNASDARSSLYWMGQYSEMVDREKDPDQKRRRLADVRERQVELHKRFDEAIENRGFWKAVTLYSIPTLIYLWLAGAWITYGSIREAIRRNS